MVMQGKGNRNCWDLAAILLSRNREELRGGLNERESRMRIREKIKTFNNHLNI